MRKRKEKLIFLFVTLVFILVLIPSFIQANNNEEKALEIVYPTIPGAPTPKTVSSGLPEYIKYIFNFSVILIGLVVLGALIYSGIQWLTSTGNPEKLRSAKQGIFSAVLGAVILLSAYLIFTTINPQLVILELPEPKYHVEPTVTPGIYLCNKNVPDIDSVIVEYMSEDRDTRIRATEELKDIMQNKQGTCFKVNASANLANFVFDQTKHTIFVIPQKEYVYIPATEDKPAETKIEWKYDYGIIFHEKDNFRGKCALGGLYNKIDPGLSSARFGAAGFSKARAVTIFEKPTKEPDPGYSGVVLYECPLYNAAPELCPEDVTNPKGPFPFAPSGINIAEIRQGNLGGMDGKTRSIIIDPEGYYFAVLFSEDGFKGDICEVISNSDNNLSDQPIGRCGFGCNWVTGKSLEGQRKFCDSCLKSMIVIKGKVIY